MSARERAAPAASSDAVALAPASDARPPLAPPVGMRDLLPPEAAERRALVRGITDGFASYGYALCTTPPFEHAEVFERAEGSFDPRDHLRFVDADTGEVALLRPDITPQIARVVATRLSDRPPPYRLAYEGHVVRRRRGRARRQRQIAQCGVECIGLSGTAGDAEVIELACRAIEGAGLASFALELALVPLVRGELGCVPEARRADATEALARKDRASLRGLLADAPPRTREALLTATELSGGAEVLRAASRVFSGAAATQLLGSLTALATRLSDVGLGARLLYDLGEVRGFGYYTGPSFSILAPGPGEPLGGGGRYDALLGRFGRDLPATGFALDVDHLGWALAAAGVTRVAASAPAVALSGASPGQLARALRARGLRVTELHDVAMTAALAWAKAWDVRFALHAGARGIDAVDRAASGPEQKFSGTAAELERWLVSRVKLKALGAERGST